MFAGFIFVKKSREKHIPKPLNVVFEGEQHNEKNHGQANVCDDLASAHVAAIKKLMQNPQSHIINLSTGKGTSVLEVIRSAERVSGKKINYEFAPRRPGDPATVVADNALAKEILGWSPRYTDIDEIIQTTWNLEE